MTGSKIIDLSHHNGKVDFQALKSSGVAGVILKATQGREDPRFEHNLFEARRVGLLCGAYHFGVAGDPEGQAHIFLAAAAGPEPLLLVLDFEDYGPKTMTIREAEAFVETVEVATGKPPGLYSGNTLRDALRGKRSPILERCWLWVPRYGGRPPIVPPGWSRWSLWQYTDQGAVVGEGKCDESRFNGDDAELALFWHAHSAPALLGTAG